MTTRERQLALYQEHFATRTDGGLTLSLDDLLLSLERVRRLGIPDEQTAEALGTTTDFVRQLRATLEA